MLPQIRAAFQATSNAQAPGSDAPAAAMWPSPKANISPLSGCAAWSVHSWPMHQSEGGQLLLCAWSAIGVQCLSQRLTVLPCPCRQTSAGLTLGPSAKGQATFRHSPPNAGIKAHHGKENLHHEQPGSLQHQHAAPASWEDFCVEILGRSSAASVVRVCT